MIDKNTISLQTSYKKPTKEQIKEGKRRRRIERRKEHQWLRSMLVEVWNEDINRV